MKKFDPVITRIKLDPEQAVLSCNCQSLGYVPGTVEYTASGTEKNFCGGGGQRSWTRFFVDDSGGRPGAVRCPQQQPGVANS